MNSCLVILLIILLLGLLVTYWPVFLIVLVLYVIYLCYKSNSNRKLHEYRFQEQCVDYDNLDGHTFEYFCADVLKKNGFYNVYVTTGSGDYGVDIIAYKNEVKYAIQCKCFSNNVGNKAVQEVYSGKTMYDADTAVVLTNRYFTESAKTTARKTEVKLWDRDILNGMVRKAQKNGGQ